MVGIKTMVTFPVTTQRNWKHRLLPEPAGCTTRVSLPPRVALMTRSCQSLKDVFLKTFTSNPISCASWCPAVGILSCSTTLHVCTQRYCTNTQVQIQLYVACDYLFGPGGHLEHCLSHSATLHVEQQLHSSQNRVASHWHWSHKSSTMTESTIIHNYSSVNIALDRKHYSTELTNTDLK